MMDQYFGNDSLEPLESIFIGSTELAMAFIWLRRRCECGGYQHTFHIIVPVVFDGKVLWRTLLQWRASGIERKLALFVALATNSDELRAKTGREALYPSNGFQVTNTAGRAICRSKERSDVASK